MWHVSLMKYVLSLWSYLTFGAFLLGVYSLALSGENDPVNMPVWAALSLIAGGGFFMILEARRNHKANDERMRKALTSSES